MPRKPRIHYTETDKALMWDRWQKGESLNEIARCGMSSQKLLIPFAPCELTIGDELSTCRSGSHLHPQRSRSAGMSSMKGPPVV